jgi:hypothetical protein
MSISTYFRPNIHQNGLEILGVKNTSEYVNGIKKFKMFELDSKFVLRMFCAFVQKLLKSANIMNITITILQALFIQSSQ